jgi:uncharacterized phage protein (TIGR01671 family)
MREILFRGKRADEYGWVEGYLLFDEAENRYRIITKLEYSTGTYIDTGYAPRVVLDTVGQFTGLTDKNGVKIFEGDIVKGRHWTSYNDKSPEEYHIWRVDWSEKSGLITFIDSPTIDIKMSIHDFADFDECEVVGNVFDNPELMGR